MNNIAIAAIIAWYSTPIRAHLFIYWIDFPSIAIISIAISFRIFVFICFSLNLQLNITFLVFVDEILLHCWKAGNEFFLISLALILWRQLSFYHFFSLRNILCFLLWILSSIRIYSSLFLLLHRRLFIFEGSACLNSFILCLEMKEF